MADPLLNAAAFKGTVVLTWQGKLGEFWVSANRGISGFIGVQGGWDTPTALVVAPSGGNTNTYIAPSVVFGHMGWCWITVGGNFWLQSLTGGAAVNVLRQSWVSKDFGVTWVRTTSSAFISNVNTPQYSPTLGQTANSSGVPIGIASDVGDGMTGAVYTDGSPEFVQVRDNAGATFYTSQVAQSFASSPFYSGFSVVGPFAGIAKVAGGWLICWNDGSGVRSAFCDSYPPLFTWPSQVMGQSVDGVHFGGGERPVVHSDTMIPVALQYPQGSDINSHQIQDKTGWMYAKTTRVNAPRYLISNGKVIPADASSDNDAIFLGSAGSGSGLSIEMEFTYGGSDLFQAEIRFSDTAEGVPGTSTVYRYCSAGYLESSQKWYIEAHLPSGLVRIDVAAAPVVGQTYHLLLVYAAFGGGPTSSTAILYVDAIQMTSLTFSAATTDLPFAAIYAGFYMRHSVFPAAYSSLGNFEVNGVRDPGPPLTSVVTIGTPGTNTYRYKISAIVNGRETQAGAVAILTTGNATLSGSNANVLSWTAVTGATGYKIYGRTGSQLLMTVVGLVTSYTDDGTVVTPSGGSWQAGSYLLSKVDRFAEFIGTKDLEAHTSDTGHSWRYGTSRMYLDGFGHVKSRNNTLGYPGVLVDQPALSPCQKVSIDFTADVANGPWAVEVLARHNNLVAPLGNYCKFGYIFVGTGLANQFYLYDDFLLGTPVTHAQTLTTGTIYNIRIEVDATSVRGYLNNVLILTGSVLPSTGPGQVGVALLEDVTAATGFRNFLATIGCSTLAALPGSLVSIARAAEGVVVGLFYVGGTVGAGANAGKYFLGWTGDKGQSWTTMSTGFATEGTKAGFPTLYLDAQKRLVPIEAGNVAVVWRDATTDLPQHKISRDNGRTLV